VVACLLYLSVVLILRTLPSLVVVLLHWSDSEKDQCSTTTTRLGRVRRINTKDNKYNRHATTNLKSLFLVTDVKKNTYLLEDGQELTETCRRIIKTFKHYSYFNVLFLIK